MCIATFNVLLYITAQDTYDITDPTRTQDIVVFMDLEVVLKRERIQELELQEFLFGINPSSNVCLFFVFVFFLFSSKMDSCN